MPGARPLAQGLQAQQRLLAQVAQHAGAGFGRAVGHVAERAQRPGLRGQQVAVDQLRELEVGVVGDQALRPWSAPRGFWPGRRVCRSRSAAPRLRRRGRAGAPRGRRRGRCAAGRADCGRAAPRRDSASRRGEAAAPLREVQRNNLRQLASVHPPQPPVIPDDEPAVAGLDQVQRLAAGDIERVGAVVLLELGRGLAALDANARLLTFTLMRTCRRCGAALFFPGLARLVAGRVEFLAVGARGSPSCPWRPRRAAQAATAASTSFLCGAGGGRGRGRRRGRGTGAAAAAGRRSRAAARGSLGWCSGGRARARARRRCGRARPPAGAARGGAAPRREQLLDQRQLGLHAVLLPSSCSARS